MTITQLAESWRKRGRENASESNAEWLYRCAQELEAASEDMGFDLEYIGALEAINKRMEGALRKIAYEIPLDISGDEAATMCEEIAVEAIGQEPND